MNNVKKWLLLALVAFSFFSIILTFVFNQDAPPVSAIEIPDTTKDFFKRLSDFGHIKFDWVDSLDIGDFNNDNDYSGDFLTLEDPNFIVYYRNSDEEKKRADKTLEYANLAIAPLSQFFGKYYYARDAKDRKLSIYLAVSEDDFAETSKEVGGSSVEWAAGVTFNSFSTSGDKLCEGIVLNFNVRDGELSDLKTVLFHEMAHYNHFQCMDLIQKPEFMNWEVEGLASFFAKDWNKKIPGNTNFNSLSLAQDPSNYLDSYWMGYHAFGLTESLGKFRDVLNLSYTQSLKTAIPSATNLSMDNFDRKWRVYCEQQLNQGAIQ